MKLIKVIMFGSGRRKVSLLLCLAEHLKRRGLDNLTKLVFLKIERDYGVYISPNAKIGSNVIFKHPTGIVIGNGVEIGNEVVIYQQVTLGAARIGDAESDLYPTIGSGTIIFAGAKVLGRIRIGENCIIGANAVVTKDIPDNHVAVGVPARYFPRAED